MKPNQSFSDLYKRLISDHHVQIEMGGAEVDVRISDHNHQITLTASVYEGGNFIPLSVRKCVKGKIPFGGQWIPTKLIINEAEYQVLLTYNGIVSEIDLQSFKDTLEEFSWQADEWRLYLEEHGRHDLVYVHAR